MNALTKIAVFASGEGTNLQALLDACRSHRVRGEIALVASTNEQAGALRRAQRAAVPVLIASPKDFATAEEHNAYLAHECKKRDIDLICLAGFMQQIKSPLLKAFPWRIMNIHPALLPSFGGKGMYGRFVHDAVIKSGARVSGCTVHFIDEVYDRGHIVAQATVPVLQADTPEVLAARVRAQEHWLYPKAVGLFCDGRIKVEDKGIEILPSHKDRAARIKRALISVSDKTGVIEFAKGLQEMGVELVSTSGTAKALQEAGLSIRPLDSVTGFPEILAGRVKTLHPNIHGAILLRRKDPVQAREAEIFGIEPIDLVAVNLYPFAQTAAKAASAHDPEVIEQIDIGGVALIRAAAKNHEDVAVLTSPADYASILEELERNQGQLSAGTRKRLALAAFKHTAEYDTMISNAWSAPAAAAPAAAAPAAALRSGTPALAAAASVPSSGNPAPEAVATEPFPETITVVLKKVQPLRYGENPHQKAALYTWSQSGAPAFAQLHGKELSYNNLLDACGTWDAVNEFSEPACVVFKHVTPSGVGVGAGLLDAFNAAWACDPLSAFGGVLAFNRPVTAEIADLLSKRFVEVLTAPGYEPKALELLKKKPNLRLLERSAPPSATPWLRSLGDEVLVTEPDRLAFGAEWRVASRRQPSKDEEAALRFAWLACKHVKSNAIVLAGPRATVGIGAGQMSRVDSVHMAGVKYKMYRRDNPAPEALVLSSDAFFPFRDGIDAAATLGISAIVQPGGSIKDAEVIAAADEHGLAMVFTGMRHFRH